MIDLHVGGWVAIKLLRIGDIIHHFVSMFAVYALLVQYMTGIFDLGLKLWLQLTKVRQYVLMFVWEVLLC